MARVHYLQHVPFEGLGSIEPWLIDHKHQITVTRLYTDEDVLPNVDDVDWLIVMGGPMGIYDYDQYPWLKIEKDFIRACIDAEKTVLGICLGGQLIADTLGAKVTRNPHVEIGWLPIQVDAQSKETEIGNILSEAGDVFHWHGDTFSLPTGATHLAKSEGCANQAYLYNGKVLGLQFHLETTQEGAKALCKECADELVPNTYVQTEKDILHSEQKFKHANQLMAKLLTALSRTLE